MVEATIPPGQSLPVDTPNNRPAPFWMRTRAFKSLCSWAFKVCDNNKTGSINKTELYAGLLLVHLKLAAYAGPAACYPPSREVVSQLFDATDDDRSGGIDEDEFVHIIVILFSELTSRIILYYTILILAVPYLIRGFLDFLNLIGVDDAVGTFEKKVWDAYAPSFLQSLLHLIPESMLEALPVTLVSTALFYLVIPICFNWVDSTLHKKATKTNTCDEDAEKKD